MVCLIPVSTISTSLVPYQLSFHRCSNSAEFSSQLGAMFFCIIHDMKILLLLNTCLWYLTICTVNLVVLLDCTFLQRIDWLDTALTSIQCWWMFTGEFDERIIVTVQVCVYLSDSFSFHMLWVFCFFFLKKCVYLLILVCISG